MPISFMIDPEKRMIIETVVGKVSMDEAIEHNQKRLEHPQYAETSIGLLDLRRANLQFTMDEINWLEDHYRKINVQIIPRHWVLRPA